MELWCGRRNPVPCCIFHHRNRQASLFIGLLSTAISQKHLGSNSKREALPSITLTEAPQQPRRLGSGAGAAKPWLNRGVSQPRTCATTTFFLLVDAVNSTFLSEAWSPFFTFDDFWLAGDVRCHAQPTALRPVGALSCQWGLMLSR